LQAVTCSTLHLYIGAAVVLLVDPSLRTNEDDSSTVALLILIDGQANVSNYDTSEAREPFAVIAEGLPPIPQKMLEKIQRWEFY